LPDQRVLELFPREMLYQPASMFGQLLGVKSTFCLQ
jgi:hypothetical protein